MWDRILSEMKVKIVPVLSDNYAYLLIAKDGTTAAVDPVEPSKVISAAQSEGVKVDCVLTTHHHWYEETLCSTLCPSAGDLQSVHHLVPQVPPFMQR